MAGLNGGLRSTPEKLASPVCVQPARVPVSKPPLTTSAWTGADARANSVAAIDATTPPCVHFIVSSITLQLRPEADQSGRVDPSFSRVVVESPLWHAKPAQPYPPPMPRIEERAVSIPSR